MPNLVSITWHFESRDQTQIWPADQEWHFWRNHVTVWLWHVTWGPAIPVPNVCHVVSGTSPHLLTQIQTSVFWLPQHMWRKVLSIKVSCIYNAIKLLNSDFLHLFLLLRYDIHVCHISAKKIDKKFLSLTIYSKYLLKHFMSPNLSINHCVASTKGRDM